MDFLTGSPFDIVNTCYLYDSLTNTWLQTYDMMENRRGAAAVQLTSDTWWVSGGRNERSVVLAFTKMFTPEQEFTSYVNLPEPKSFWLKSMRLTSCYWEKASWDCSTFMKQH